MPRVPYVSVLPEKFGRAVSLHFFCILQVRGRDLDYKLLYKVWPLVVITDMLITFNRLPYVGRRTKIISRVRIVNFLRYVKHAEFPESALNTVIVIPTSQVRIKG